MDRALRFRLAASPQPALEERSGDPAARSSSEIHPVLRQSFQALRAWSIHSSRERQAHPPYGVESPPRGCKRIAMFDSIFKTAIHIIAAFGIWFAACLPAAASHLVTGNGHGTAVVAPDKGAATR